MKQCRRAIVQDFLVSKEKAVDVLRLSTSRRLLCLAEGTRYFTGGRPQVQIGIWATGLIFFYGSKEGFRVCQLRQ